MTLQQSKTEAIAAMLTMYTTDWCGYCVRLKDGLERAGISYAEVNIERQPDAAELVMRVNGGNQTVPTVVFPDGTAMTNPSLRDIKEKLAA
ncbi:MAG TPA: mycoredoxin [Jatrophihabitans sp.]|nr:mycoredoxin [Jatrophihabitans sp.]